MGENGQPEIVPEKAANAELKALNEGGFQMVVYGHAIQAAGFADADAAWTAFDEQMKDSVTP